MSNVNKHNIKAKSHILSLLGDELIGSDSLAIFELVKMLMMLMQKKSVLNL